ncbi:hypothetical protein FA506_27605 [Pseudomonas aeruginosa]|nr:hypothetical protein [Pseudomonas aeruginosa]
MLIRHLSHGEDFRLNRCPGSVDHYKALLTTTLPTKLSFCVIGVQPGIRRTMVNERLSDLMAFCIGYVRGGGTAKAYWLVSE